MLRSCFTRNIPCSGSASGRSPILNGAVAPNTNSTLGRPSASISKLRSDDLTRIRESFAGSTTQSAPCRRIKVVWGVRAVVAWRLADLRSWAFSFHQVHIRVGLSGHLSRVSGLPLCMGLGHLLLHPSKGVAEFNLLSPIRFGVKPRGDDLTQHDFPPPTGAPCSLQQLREVTSSGVGLRGCQWQGRRGGLSV
jgi:hypothetical protein